MLALSARPPAPADSIGALESHLRDRRAAGRKLLVPYLTGGLPGWERHVEAVAASGADAIEIGLPFSDPVMDGPVIQQASAQALDAGATPPAIWSRLRELDLGGVPTVVMTYYNVAYRMGHRRFAAELVSAGVMGAILPDLPLDEVEPWAHAADLSGVATILLAAPTTPDERLRAICERSRGWVYGVGLMGVTGERDALAASATLMAQRLVATTDRPVLIGIGVSTPAQAAQAAAECDGVIVGSSIVRRVLAGETPEQVGEFVAELRAGLDGTEVL